MLQAYVLLDFGFLEDRDFLIHFCISHTQKNAYKGCYLNELFWDRGSRHPITAL